MKTAFDIGDTVVITIVGTITSIHINKDESDTYTLCPLEDKDQWLICNREMLEKGNAQKLSPDATLIPSVKL